MGCDIHLYVETRQAGKWQLHPGYNFDCDSCKGTGLSDQEKRCANCLRPSKEHVPQTLKCLYGPLELDLVPAPCSWYGCVKGKTFSQLFYDRRDYDLFGILAGVRGRMREGFTAHDRGLPDDVSSDARSTVHGDDYHSHGYYTLPELLEQDWTDYTLFKERLDLIATFDPDPENVRVVFAYDN